MRPVSIPTAVDFPAPLGPRRARSSPARTCRSSPRTAWTVAEPFPNCLQASTNSARTEGSWLVGRSRSVSCVVVIPPGSRLGCCGSSAWSHHLCMTGVMPRWWLPPNHQLETMSPTVACLVTVRAERTGQSAPLLPGHISQELPFQTGSTPLRPCQEVPGVGSLTRGSPLCPPSRLRTRSGSVDGVGCRPSGSLVVIRPLPRRSPPAAQPPLTVEGGDITTPPRVGRATGCAMLVLRSLSALSERDIPLRPTRSLPPLPSSLSSTATNPRATGTLGASAGRRLPDTHREAPRWRGPRTLCRAGGRVATAPSQVPGKYRSRAI